MKKNRLALNTWTGIFDIVNCILFAVSQNVIWVTVFSDASTGEYGKVIAIRIFFYAMAWIGISLNIWALVQSKKHCISLAGSVLGIIGNVLFVLTATIAFLPAALVLIVAAVFIMLQKPANNTTAQNINVQVTENITEDPKKQDKQQSYQPRLDAGIIKHQKEHIFAFIQEVNMAAIKEYRKKDGSKWYYFKAYTGIDPIDWETKKHYLK